MKINIFVLCVVLMSTVYAQSKRRNTEFNKEELECLAKTGVSRQIVLQDKGYKFPAKPATDRKFADYLECYRDKLQRLGKLFYTKNTHVTLPGYKTRVPIPGIYCTDDDFSGKDPSRQCAIRP